MPEPRAPYASPTDWLADAARLFAGRIADHLGTGAPEATVEIRLSGLVETGDARALAADIVAGPARPPRDPPDRAALAARLSSPVALAGLPIGQLLDSFTLSPDWALPLALMSVVQQDPRFARLLGWLNDDAQRRHLTPALIATLCGGDATDWSAHPLVQLHAIDTAGRADQLPMDHPVSLSPPVARWLCGDARNDPLTAGLLHPARSLPLEDLLGADLAPAPFGPFVSIGPDGAGRRAVAAAILLRRGRAAQVLDARQIAQDPRGLLARALRDTTLDGQALIIAQADILPEPLLHWLCAIAPGGFALTAQDRLPLDLPQIRIPDLDADRIRRLWSARLGPNRTHEAGRLAHQFRLPVDGILAIPADPSRSYDAIRQDCLDRSAGTLARLATLVPSRYGWDDLVLPPRQTQALKSIVQRARHARAVYDDWGFGRKLVPNRGLSALFSGPSGAGKTLSASVVARAIGLPLYRVDLSATVSKYIGETEKNLEQIFSAAESSNACLLFDECDALFGKRSDVSDAHDRYANIETSYLLQRMEHHRGVVMMSSNHPQNIDEAFMRRIDLAIEFALPDAALRMALWDRLMPPEAEAEIDAVRLGEQFELTGGTIRNCLVTAAFLAAEAGERITTDHCIRAVALEYEKTRRPLTRAEFGKAYPALRSRKGT